MINKSLFSSKIHTWETPFDLFEKLDETFNFNTDVCASKDNAKCKNFFDIDVNGLSQRWEGNCWMNPPYGREQIKWIEKAHDESTKGSTVVCLIPARPDTKIWHNIIFKKAKVICFIKGRLKFGGSNDSAPFPSALIVFSPHITNNQIECLSSLGKTFINKNEE